jgi:transcriptional regulator with XRE-family HTH domain
VVPPRDPLLVGLGQTIRDLRLERGEISQETLGHESDLHRNYIGGIERAERKPAVEAIAKIALAFDLAPSQLLARAEREAERLGAKWPEAARGDGSTGAG